MADLDSVRRQNTTRRVLTEIRPTVNAPVPNVADFSGVMENIANITQKIASDQDLESKENLARAYANFDEDIQLRSMEMREEYAYNPDDFEVEWEKYGAEVLSQTSGTMSQDVNILLKKRKNQVLRSLLSEKRTQDRKLSAASLKTQEATRRKELKESIPGTEEHLSTLKSLNANIKIQQNLGFLTKPEAENAIDKTAFDEKKRAVVLSAKSDAAKGKYKKVSDLKKQIDGGEYFGEIDQKSREKISQEVMAEVHRDSVVFVDNHNRLQTEAENDIYEQMKQDKAAFYEQLFSGKVSPEWLSGKENSLSYFDRQVAKRAVLSEPVAKTDNSVFSRIESIDDPEQKVVEAKASYAQGLMTTDDLKNTMKEAETEQNTGKDKTRALVSKFARRMKVPSYMKDKYSKDFNKMRRDFIGEYEDFIQANPTATEKELSAAEDRIALKVRENVLDMLQPPYRVSEGKKEISLQSLSVGAKSLSEDYKSGKISKNELLRQAEIFATWKNFLADEKFRKADQ